MNISEKKYTPDELKENYLKFETCPISAAMQKMGGKWKPIILYLIAHQVNRFGKMLGMIEGISKTMLTAQLRELEQDGIIRRDVFAEVPPRVEYYLTDFGLTLRPVLMKICEWGLEKVLEREDV